MSNRGEGHACVRLYVRVSMCLEIPAGTGVTEHSTAARDSLVRVDRVALYLYPIQITLLRIEPMRTYGTVSHAHPRLSSPPSVTPVGVSCRHSCTARAETNSAVSASLARYRWCVAAPTHVCAAENGENIPSIPSAVTAHAVSCGVCAPHRTVASDSAHTKTATAYALNAKYGKTSK